VALCRASDSWLCLHDMNSRLFIMGRAPYSQIDVRSAVVRLTSVEWFCCLCRPPSSFPQCSITLVLWLACPRLVSPAGLQGPAFFPEVLFSIFHARPAVKTLCRPSGPLLSLVHRKLTPFDCSRHVFAWSTVPFPKVPSVAMWHNLFG